MDEEDETREEHGGSQKRALDWCWAVQDILRGFGCSVVKEEERAVGCGAQPPKALRQLPLPLTDYNFSENPETETSGI